MANKIFTSGTVVDSSWLQDVNDSTYKTGSVPTPIDVTHHADPSKTTPVDADEIAMADSANAFSFARLTWANLKATLVTYLSALTSTWAINTTGNAATATTVTSTINSGVAATTQASLDNSTKVATTAFVQGAMQGQYFDNKIQPVTATVAANALTLGLNPTTLDFRSTTLTTGVPTTVQSSSALSLVIPAGATLGTTNGILARLLILAINNAGTMELAVYNQAGGGPIDETGVTTTVAITGASNSATTVYSTNARSNVPYRLVGYVELTEATAGTWATAPSLVQGIGGCAGVAAQSFGMGQSWQSVTRTSGTTYYNITSRPILLSAIFVLSAGASGYSITVSGVTVALKTPLAGETDVTLSAVIPPGASYVLTYSGGTPSITAAELR